MKYILFLLFLLIQAQSRGQSLGACNAMKETILNLKKRSSEICVVDSMILDGKRTKKRYFDDLSIYVGKSVANKAYAFSLKDTIASSNHIVCKDFTELIPFDRVDSVILSNYKLRDINRLLVDSVYKEINVIYNLKSSDAISKRMDSFERTKIYLEYKAKVLDAAKNVLVFERPVIVDNKYLFLFFHIKNNASHYFSFTHIYKNKNSKWVFYKEKG